MTLNLFNTGSRKSTLLVLLALLLAASFAPAQEPADESPQDTALADAGERLLVRVEQRRKEISEWEELRDRYEGDDRRAIELELTDKRLQVLSDLHRLAANVVEQEAGGLVATDLRKRVEPLMRDLPPLIRAALDDARANASELRGQRDEASPEELLDLEQRIARADDWILRIIKVYFDQIQSMEAMGLDAAAEKEWLENGLSNLAEFLSRRLELTLERKTDVQEQTKARPEDTTLSVQLSALDERLAANVASLRSSVEIMKLLGLDTEAQQELIARTTGDVTDMLDTKIALGLVGQLLAQGKQSLIEYSPRVASSVIVFLLILLVFRFLAGMARRVVVRALSSSKVQISKLLEDMITSMVRRAVMILGFLVALSQVGVSLGPLLAGLGVAGFVLGFALQNTLSNFASGLMILFYRPFDVDDLVEVAGVFGMVSRMTLVSTTILTLDHQTLIVPNTKIWDNVIKNVTTQKIRRVDMTFGISYTDDIPKAEGVLNDILREHPRILEDPEPMVRLHNLGDSSVDFVVRPWVATEDYWDIHWDVTREVKMRFDREGISIPFPQRDVHIHSQTPPSE